MLVLVQLSVGKKNKKKLLTISSPYYYLTSYCHFFCSSVQGGQRDSDENTPRIDANEDHQKEARE